jgi:uncharacterized protein YcbK (DUF882 family)
MKLSRNFTLKELTATDQGIPNTPNEVERQFLKLLAIYLLQPTRNKFGSLKVNSGFRSTAVNRMIGGSMTSQHIEGQAADIVPLETSIFKVYGWLVNESSMDYGQCIIYPENGFVHISLPRLHKPNNQALICYKDEYLPYSEDKLNEIIERG